MIFSLSWLSPLLLKDTTISSRTIPCVEIFRTQIIILLLNLECKMSQKCHHTLAFVARFLKCVLLFWDEAQNTRLSHHGTKNEISSVSVAKSARNPQWKTSFFDAVLCNIMDQLWLGFPEFVKNDCCASFFSSEIQDYLQVI